MRQLNNPILYLYFVCRRGAGVRVSGGDLDEVEAPTEPAGETDRKAPCKIREDPFYDYLVAEVIMKASPFIQCGVCSV